MNTSTRQRTNLIISAMYLCTAAMAFIWFIDYSQRLISGDLILLTQFASRFLEGKMMSEAYFDTNPPMSIIVYSVPAIATKFFNVSLFTAINFYTLMFVVLSTYLTSCLLKVFQLGRIDHHLVLCTFFLYNTLYSGAFFGAKDQFTLLALLPFCLAQINITYNTKTSPFALYISLVLGAFFLMVKPLFYLAPISIFLHRIYVRKKILSVFDRDSFLLTLFAGIYGLSLLTYFNDFTTLILPDTIDLYLTIKHTSTPLITTISTTCVALTFAWALYFVKESNLLNFILFCLFTAAIGILVGHVQNKAHYMHYIPATGLYTIALSLTTFHTLLLPLIKNVNTYFAKSIALVTVFTLLGLVASHYFIKPTRLEYQKDYKRHKLVEYVINNTNDQDKFYMMSVFSEYPLFVSAISERESISRLPSVWFWLRLRYDNAVKDKTKRDEYLRKYMSMIVEDITKHKPKILFFENFKPEQYETRYNFFDDLITFGSNSEAIMNSYTYKETITLDREPNMPPSLPEQTPFHVYVRKQ